MENDWTLDSAIQSELSDKWYDQPDVVAGIKLNTITVKPKEYERLNEAKRQYPYLQDKDFDYVENLTDDKKAGYLEFWEPGDEGPPDGSVKRPEGIGIDRMGIEVRNPNTRPIDILGDYVSHEAVYSDPKLKDIYDRYTSTLTDKQLKVKYENEKKNYGEDRPFEQWAERSGKPGMFRGYTFDQFSEDEIKEAYTEEQLKILDEARDYLGIKKLNYEGKDVEIDKPLSVESIVKDWSATYQTTNNPEKEKRATKVLNNFNPSTMPKEAVSAVETASYIFEGDKGQTAESITQNLNAIGAIESNYKTKVQKKGGPARSYWQVEPTTAQDNLINGSALLGKKFEETFKRYAKDGKTAVQYLKGLSLEEWSDVLEKDDELGAAMAAHKFIRTRK